jgi:hypothetical protein
MARNRVVNDITPHLEVVAHHGREGWDGVECGVTGHHVINLDSHRNSVKRLLTTLSTITSRNPPGPTHEFCQITPHHIVRNPPRNQSGVTQASVKQLLTTLSTITPRNPPGATHGFCQITPHHDVYNLTHSLLCLDRVGETQSPVSQSNSCMEALVHMEESEIICL